MKIAIIDALFVILYVVVLAIGYFSYIDTVIFSIALFVLLLATVTYGIYVNGKTENVGEEYEEMCRLREEREKKLTVISRMVAVIDLMQLRILELRKYVRGCLYELE